MIARFLLAVLLFIARPAVAEDVTLAVASNFAAAAEALGDAFTGETGIEVRIAHGATGQLYAQIANGAPFNMLLAADEVRPARLLEEGLAEEVAIYALGRIALVSRRPVAGELSDAVAGKTVVLADPTVAPYGAAAVTVMERLRLDTGTFRPVLVANVGQVASVFATGNADFAFVSEAQVSLLDDAFVTDLDGIAPEVRQAAALLKDPSEPARAFWRFLFSDAGVKIVTGAGYGAPE